MLPPTSWWSLIISSIKFTSVSELPSLCSPVLMGVLLHGILPISKCLHVVELTLDLGLRILSTLVRLKGSAKWYLNSGSSLVKFCKILALLILDLALYQPSLFRNWKAFWQFEANLEAGNSLVFAEEETGCLWNVGHRCRRRRRCRWCTLTVALMSVVWLLRTGFRNIARKDLWRWPLKSYKKSTYLGTSCLPLTIPSTR